MYGGNDTVYAASLKLSVYDTWGNLSIHGAAGFMDINKSGDGNMSVNGAAGAVSLNHTGQSGNISFNGGAASNKIYRSGHSGGVTFKGIGISNRVVNQVKYGNIKFTGSGLSNVVERRGGEHGDIYFMGAGASNKVTNSANRGSIYFTGIGAYNRVERRGHSGNIAFTGLGFYNHVTNATREGNIDFIGIGAYNKVERLGGYKGNIFFKGAGIGNHIVNTAKYGNTEFIGGGGANVIEHSANGNISFKGIGAINKVSHTGDYGDIDFIGGGVGNIITRSGIKGNGDLTILGGGNVVTWSTDGKLEAKLGGFRLNLLKRYGRGDTNLILVSLGNIVDVEVSKGNLSLTGIGAANVVNYKGEGTLDAELFGGANIITREGSGNSILYLLAGGNVFTDFSTGDVRGSLLGGLNIVTKEGDGNIDVDMYGGSNVLTQVGNGNIQVRQFGGANIITKSGDGNIFALLFGLANVVTHVGDGDVYLLMLGMGNVATKVGDGDVVVGMFGIGNVLTHVGNGMTAALMVSVGVNFFTKVGNGPTLALMFSMAANIFTHIGNGPTAALMIGGLGNIFTKVGNGPSVAIMLAGKANIFTHIGNGFSAALMIGGLGNIFTKVGNGTTLAAMVGNANIFTHIGNGFSVAFAIGQANIVTKVGSGHLITAAIGQANIVTHVNLDSKGNTVSLVVGRANIVTRVSSLTDFTVTVSPLDAVVSDPVLEKHRLFPRGDVFSAPQKFLTSGVDSLKATGAALLGEGNEGSMVTFAIGQANIITHVGNGAMLGVGIGSANIISKVGLGQTIQAGIGRANILTSVGDNDSLQIAIGKANLVTKVGSGHSAMIAIGRANITTKVGDGFHLGLSVGKLNINTNIGDGIAINALIGKYNLNTRVGHGVNIAVMKGDYNVNVRYGDGMNIALAAGKGNITVNIGDGDFYGAMIEVGTNKQSVGNKMKALMRGMLSNLKETAKSVLVSQTIGLIINGNDANTTKFRGTSHSTPKKDSEYTQNASSTNKEVDQSQYQDTDANEDSDVSTQSEKDQQTVDSLKSDTQVNEDDANKDAQVVTGFLDNSNSDNNGNNNNLIQNQGQNQNQDYIEGLNELNQIGQSDHHNDYTQFGTTDKVTSKANQIITNSKEGINKSKSKTQEELNNVKQRNQKNQSHQQNEQQKVGKHLGDANQKYQEAGSKKIKQKGAILVAMNIYQTSVDGHPENKNVFEIGDKITVALTMDKAMQYQKGRAEYAADSKIIINGLVFSLDTKKGFSNPNATPTESTKLVFEHTVQANDAFTQGKEFSIKSSSDLIISGISDSNGYPPAFINTAYPISLSNTVATKFDKRNLTVAGDTFQGYTIEKKSGASWDTDVFSQESFIGDGYAIFTLNATSARKGIMLGLSTDNPDGSYKTIEHAVYIYNNKIKDVRNNNTKYADFNYRYKVGDKIKIERHGTTIKYYHLNNNGNTIRILATQTGIPATSALHIDTSIKDEGVKLTGVKLVKGLSNISQYIIDVHAPKPIANNAWHIDGKTTNKDNILTIGDKIKVTLTLDEAVTLAKVGTNKIMIAGKAFLLTGTNGNITNTLEFTYTIQVSDTIANTDLNINNKYDITLLDIQDTDGNNIDFSSITNANPVHFSKTLLGANSTDFVIGGGNIAHNNGVYEKTSGTGWNADVTSSKGFINDGYVIAKIGASDKKVMLGLSSGDTNNSYNSINYALYADPGADQKFVIYENSVKKYSTGVSYAMGDYMKVIRSGTTIKW
jgi:hypothetical protein